MSHVCVVCCWCWCAVAPAGYKCDTAGCLTASLCVVGTYKSTADRSTTCTSCGTNLTTAAEGSTSQTSCGEGSCF